MRSNIKNWVNLFSTLSSKPVRVVYDGDGEGEGGGDGGGDSTPTNTDTNADGTTNADGVKSEPVTFTQEDLNKILADDRRKHAAKLSEVESQLTSLANSAQLTATEREELKKSRQQLQKQLMTSEQLAAKEKKDLAERHEVELEQAVQERDTILAKYEDSTIRRQLSDAAISAEAFNPAQIVDLLRGQTKLVDDQPIVTLRSKDVETGEPVELTLDPAGAVKHMSELKALYGNLFKSNIIGGIGGGATTDGLSGDTHVDIKNMAPEKYAKMRREQPHLLGLK